jgi:hypothetical protein
VLDSLAAQPGFGFITVRQHKRDEDDPDEIVVPVGAIRRIELSVRSGGEHAFGFTLPGPG